MKRAKGKGVRAMGRACKVQHTTKGGLGEGPGCPEARAGWPSCHLSVPPAPHLAPSHPGLCSPDNSKQTGLTLGLVTGDSSWEDEEPRDPWAKPGQRRAEPRGGTGGRDKQSSPAGPAASLRNARAGAAVPAAASQGWEEVQEPPRPACIRCHAPPGGPRRAVPCPHPCTSGRSTHVALS